MKLLSTTKINLLPHLDSRKLYSLQKGSGLFVVVEKKEEKGESCKRIVGYTRYPLGRKGTNVEVKFGVWGKDIKTKEDLQRIYRTWLEQKLFCKTTGRHPYKFGKEEIKTERTLGEVVDCFLEYHKLEVKELSYKTSVGRLNQILEFLDGDRPISDFYLPSKGRELVCEMHDHIKKGAVYGKTAITHASKCRKLIKQVFEYAIDRGWWNDTEYNPATRKVLGELQGHVKKPHPHLSWKEIPEFLETIENNSSNSYVLTRLLTKFYLLSCIRVNAICCLEWEWFDFDNDLIVIPPETSGLKRKKGSDLSHLIPITDEMKVLIKQLKEINGNEKYVFKSRTSKNRPYPDKGRINDFFRKLGYSGRQDAHGWRHVVTTNGVDVGGFDSEIISRQIGHTDHKKGSIGSYDFSEKLDERREFLNWWNKELVRQGMKLVEKELQGMKI